MLKKELALQTTSLLALIAHIYSAILSDNITYSCNPGGSVTVSNPDSHVYKYALANNSETECFTFVSSDKRTFLITGCVTDMDIRLVLSSSDLALQEIIAGESVTYILRCSQIRNDGVERSIRDESFVTIVAKALRQMDVTPSLIVVSRLLDPVTGLPKPSALLGEELSWEIEGPSDYLVMPESCIAFSGRVPGGITSKNITEYGCTMDIDLVTDFKTLPRKRNLLNARLFAFRFIDSPFVTIVCKVRGCPPSSTSCVFNCPLEKRMRFERELEKRDEFLSTLLLQETVSIYLQILFPQTASRTAKQTKKTHPLSLFQTKTYIAPTTTTPGSTSSCVPVLLNSCLTLKQIITACKLYSGWICETKTRKIILGHTRLKQYLTRQPPPIGFNNKPISRLNTIKRGSY